jgi:hypothetical protein
VFCSALVVSPANADSYQYSFLANPDADSGNVVDPALDVLYTLRFDGNRIPRFDLATLNTTAHWTSGAISLSMEFNGAKVFLNDALEPSAQYLSIKADDTGGGSSYPGGVVEIYPIKSEFLDIDFHPWSSFVLGNGLPFSPFVYGQLDVYDAQQQFGDAYDLWVNGDTSKLAQYTVASVPEPSAAAMFAVGGLLCVAAARRKARTNARLS